MTNKFFVTIIIIALLVCATLYYHQREETNTLKENVSELKTANAKLTKKSEETEKLYSKHSEELQKELASLMSKINELEQCLADQTPIKRFKKITKNSEGKAVTDYMSGLARMMEHSTLRESTRAGIREHAVNVVYGDFIKNAIMDKNEAEIISELLVDKSFARFGRKMEMLDPKLSSARKKVIVKQIKEDRAAIDKKIEGMLSKKLFQKYLEYEKTSQEILFVNRFKIKLSNESIQPLTKRQQNALIKLIYKERINIEKKADYISLEYASRRFN